MKVVSVFTRTRQAKEQQLRIWKGYQPPSASAPPIKSKNFTGKVVEVVNADALVVRTPDGADMKIHFSSLRPPPRYVCGQGVHVRVHVCVLYTCAW